MINQTEEEAWRKLRQSGMDVWDSIYHHGKVTPETEGTFKSAALAYAEKCGYRKVNDRHRRTNSKPRDFDVEGVDFVRISKEDWDSADVTWTVESTWKVDGRPFRMTGLPHDEAVKFIQDRQIGDPRPLRLLKVRSIRVIEEDAINAKLEGGE